jgi:hypothetical protein
VYLFGAIFSLLYGLPFFWLLQTRSPIVIGLAILLGVVFGHNAMYGPQAAYFSELFGASVRYSGASLAYQLASVACGRVAPFIATALLAAHGVSGGRLHDVARGGHRGRHLACAGDAQEFVRALSGGRSSAEAVSSVISGRERSRIRRIDSS